MTFQRVVARYAIFIALVAECVTLALSTDAFLTADNLANVLRQNAFPAVIATGMTFVILTGVALSGVLCADAIVQGWGIAGGVAIGLGTGVLVGLVNGLVVTRLGVAPFVVTLATMLIVRGAAFKYTDARTISGLPASFAVFSQMGPMAIALAMTFAVAWILLMRTPFGRHVYATGGNREAALLSGIRVSRVLVHVYVLCGLGAGLAGVLVASRLSAGYPRAGELYELDAIAAVVVGGTSLAGGRGSIWGTLAGAFFIGILNNGLNLYNVSPYDQMLVKGLVFLTAASLDRWRQ